MKKFYFFVCAMAVSIIAIAQNFQTKSLNNSAIMTISKVKSVEMNQTPTAPGYAADKPMPASLPPAMAQQVESQYYYTPGQMHAGFSSAGGLYYPQLLIPYQDSITWYSYWRNDVDPTWYHGNGSGQIWKENSTTYGVNSYDICGQYYLPIVGEGTYTSESNDIIFRNYMYGESYPTKTYLSVAATENWYPMTLCEMWTDTVGGKSQDFYQVGAGSVGKYANGTNMVFPEGSPYEGRVDTMLQVVENVSQNGIFKINSMQIAIYGQSGMTVADMLPEGAKVKVEIIPVIYTSQGRNFYFKDPIATTTFDANDFTAWSYSNVGMITVTFKDKDEQVVPVYVKGSYAVVFTNYNESGCNFGIRSDYYCPKTNSTLFKKNGLISTIWNGGGNNIAINYIGYWPSVYEDDGITEMVAPENGGLATGGAYEELQFTTNVDFTKYIYGQEEVSDEWMSIIYDDSYFKDYHVLQAAINCEPLPAGVSGREGTVTFNFDGVKYPVKVTQGVPTGVNAIKENNVANKTFKKEMRNGKVIIKHNGKKYNTLGIEL